MQALLDRFLVWRNKNIKDKDFILLLSVVIGLLSGLTALTLKSSVRGIRRWLLDGVEFRHDEYLLLILPIVGITITVLFKRFILRDSIKHNVASILHAISKRNSLMKRHKVFSSILGGTFTAGFGGSIGLESPIISSGSAIGSNIGRMMRLNYKTNTLLLACGAAGAISAIFNTPIAGIVFALEVLMIDLTRFSLIPLLMSSVSGAIVTKIFGEEAILFNFDVATFHLSEVPLYAVFGIVAGLISVYFTRMFLFIETTFERIKNQFGRLILGGVVLGVLIFIFPALYGEGYVVIENVLNGNYQDVVGGSFIEGLSEYVWGFILIFVLLMFFKVIATASTIGSGGIGGIFAPSLYTGAISGFLFAHVYNSLNIGAKVPESNFAFVGMAGILCGVLHAPLTGIFLIAEITSGYDLIVPLMLTTAFSFVTVKYFQPNSIFTIQLAQRGELITHHKDKAVLTFMKLHNVIEKDLKTVAVDSTLGELVKIISKSNRNIFPVINKSEELQGIIYIENIRDIMFNQELYEDTFVRNLMITPPTLIYSTDNMDVVAEKFRDNNVWNLPVIDNGKYIGFVSKSKLFSEYRKLLIDISEE